MAIGGNTTNLLVKIGVDASQAASGFDEASGKVGKFKSTMGKLAVPAAAALGGIAAFGKVAVDEASRVQQAYGALDSVFGKNSATVKQWAEDAATSVGLSKAEYGEFASVIGAQLNNLTGDSETALAGTQDLIGIGADLAATFGGTTADAVGALSAALRGEADPAERYGLALNQTAVNARLAEKGLDGLTGDALAAAKAQTVLELANEQAGDALGQFGREADSAAGSAQITAAQWANVRGELGEALLPVVSKLTQGLGEVAKWVSQNQSLVTGFVATIAGLSTAILAVNGAMKAWNAITAIWQGIQKAATAAQWLWNAAMNANPVMLVVTAIAALVGAVIYLWNTNEGFRNFILGMWEAIKNAAVAAWEWIKQVVTSFVQWITPYIQAAGQVIQNVWNAIKTAAETVWNWIQNVVQVVIAAVTAYINAYKTAVLAVWNAIKSAAQAVWNWIQNVVNTVTKAITAYINAMKAGIVAAWNAIKQAATTVWNAIKSVVMTVVNAIRTIVQNVGNTIKTIFNGIKTAVTNVFRSIQNVARSAINAILAPIRAVKSAFDSVVSAVKNLIGWIGKIKMPNISLPKMPWQRSAAMTTARAAPAFARSMAAPLSAAGATGARSGGTLVGAVNSLRSLGTAAMGGVTVINVQGGLDSSDAIARRIERVVRGRDRRTSSISVGGVR